MQTQHSFSTSSSTQLLKLQSDQTWSRCKQPAGHRCTRRQPTWMQAASRTSFQQAAADMGEGFSAPRRPARPTRLSATKLQVPVTSIVFPRYPVSPALTRGTWCRCSRHRQPSSCDSRGRSLTKTGSAAENRHSHAPDLTCTKQRSVQDAGTRIKGQVHCQHRKHACIAPGQADESR